MNKMLIAVFDSESSAFKGLNSLKELHTNGDMSLYATAVIAKDSDGVIHIKQEADKGPAGAAIGMVSGSLVGILGGPVGVAIGAGLGGLTGLLFDLDRSGVDLQFVKDVSEALAPGKVAILADITESWTTPVDSRMAEHGGIVFRRLRSEVIEDQYLREVNELETEVAELEAEWSEAGNEAKEKIHTQLELLKQKSELIANKATERIQITKSETEAKITTLRQQMNDSSERRKAKIEKRISEVTADFNSRCTKLKEVGEHAKVALHA